MTETLLNGDNYANMVCPRCGEKAIVVKGEIVQCGSCMKLITHRASGPPQKEIRPKGHEPGVR